MSAGLIARSSNNELLFDTRSISYGLVKSGNLTYIENWRRLGLRGINVDPNIGSSWVERGLPGDNQWGFTISNSVSPIVFLVGKGVVTGVKVVDANTKTFLFACADQNTKYYCFDLMRTDGITGPGLITRDINNNVTFNSGQVPLNVVAAIQAPVYGPLDSYGRPIVTYVNGRNEIIQQDLYTEGVTHCVVDIPLDSGTEYAAFLPWNRSCGIISDVSGRNTWDIYGVSEGAYGRIGGMSFMFGPPGRTTEDQWTRTRQTYISYHLLPADRYPTALVIKTTNLPFPLN